MMTIIAGGLHGSHNYRYSGFLRTKDYGTGVSFRPGSSFLSAWQSCQENFDTFIKSSSYPQFWCPVSFFFPFCATKNICHRFRLAVSLQRQFKKVIISINHKIYRSSRARIVFFFFSFFFFFCHMHNLLLARGWKGFVALPAKDELEKTIRIVLPVL